MAHDERDPIEIAWNGHDLPAELTQLPPGRYRIEPAVDWDLTPDEEAGLEEATASLRRGEGGPGGRSRRAAPPANRGEGAAVNILFAPLAERDLEATLDHIAAEDLPLLSACGFGCSGCSPSSMRERWKVPGARLRSQRPVFRFHVHPFWILYERHDDSVVHVLRLYITPDGPCRDPATAERSKLRYAERGEGAASARARRGRDRPAPSHVWHMTAEWTQNGSSSPASNLTGGTAARSTTSSRSRDMICVSQAPCSPVATKCS